MVSTDQQTSTSVEGLSRKYTEVTKRLEKLQRLSDDISNDRLSDELREEAPELSQKLAENEKCRYRIGRIEELNQVGGQQVNGKEAHGQQVSGKKPKEEKVSRKYVKVLDYGDSILECLISVFDGVVKQIFPQIDISVQLRETSNLKFGDYQFDSCPLITKKLSDLGVKNESNASCREGHGEPAEVGVGRESRTCQALHQHLPQSKGRWIAFGFRILERSDCS
ncbi:Arginyl-tRNA synthetase [Aphelenchoides besseyi]|nr:Arginyl-tRNA synthetase [Aphelenchoides besseyi]